MAQAPASVLATKARARQNVAITDNTDVALPYGPGAGRRLGPILYGGYQGLNG